MTDFPEQPGFWQSALDEQTVIAGSVEFSQPGLSPEGVPYWVAYEPEAEGRNLLYRCYAGITECLTPSGFSVRSRVHEYGGQAWCFIGDQAVVFVNASDQQLYHQTVLPKVEPPRKLTCAERSRFIEPVYDQRRQRLICVEECHLSGRVDNRLVAVDLLTGVITPLHQGHDFYAYPTLSASGEQLAFIVWNHPVQPWLNTCCFRADLTVSGDILILHAVTGSTSDVALSQPYFRDDGTLYLVSDETGYWQVHQVVADHVRPQPLLDDPIKAADCINAPWQSGFRHYGYRSSGHWLTMAFQHAGSRLLVDQNDLPIEGFNSVRHLVVADDQALLIAAGAQRLPAVLLLDSKNGIQHLAGGEMPLITSECSLPEPEVFADDQSRCYGYLYKPKNSRYAAYDSAPPLVIFLHGGPTAATYPVLNLKLQYWTQRGFAVLDLNYRGSSNYGRDYRLALAARWGQVEIEDIRLAVSQLIVAGKVDPQAIFIRGNSSGGYSALNALCELDCFAAGASLYGVTDPLALGKVTHKFESYYLDWLIADPQTGQAQYAVVSPLCKVDKIKAPVIFFQGGQDPVVVPEQTRQMVSALRNAGIPVEECYFPEEGHGFRQPDNLIKVLQRELKFYQAYILPK
ncbi:alpha/beta hydrolase family protein [Pontibacter sp. JAM-7]|uniref:alpha/beta hydrolase family protein n=1 Tax=Pontibacter sp. JAM-7 TaxID=3366581 RepID=UPI003AF84102